MRPIKISSSYTNIEDESFRSYLKEISTIDKFSSSQEEYEVSVRASQGDQAAKDELVSRNLRFVVSVAKQYVRDGIPLVDLVNEGNYGMLLAVENFKPTLGNKFISYAVWWIRKTILMYTIENAKGLRIPSNRVNDLSNLNKKIHELEQINGNKVDIEEVIDWYWTGKEGEDNSAEIAYYKNLDKISSFKMDSLDKQLGDEGGSFSLVDVIEDSTFEETDHLLTNNETNLSVNKMLSTLKEREKQVMVLLYGLEGNREHSLLEISVIMGVSRERARQIREKTLKKLKTSTRISSPSLG